jgi:hypothetical protein
MSNNKPYPEYDPLKDNDYTHGDTVRVSKGRLAGLYRQDSLLGNFTLGGKLLWQLIGYIGEDKYTGTPILLPRLKQPKAIECEHTTGTNDNVK